MVVDSHAEGPPEGPPVPTVVPSTVYAPSEPLRGRATAGPAWPPVTQRTEVQAALSERAAAYTRVRDEAPSALLFVTEPVTWTQGRSVVYATRSTRPVLEGVYRIRSALVQLMALVVLATALVTLAVGLSVARPLERIARAMRRIGAGSLDEEIPVVGAGEIRDVAAAPSRSRRQCRGHSEPTRRRPHRRAGGRPGPVPEALRPHLFERFFTTEAAERGTGLGLAIVRSVAEAHGGRAYLDPCWTEGARFVIELPTVRSDARG